MTDVARQAKQTKEEQYQKSLQWRLRNRDKIREYNKQNYQKHKSTILARQRLRKEISVMCD